MQPLSNTIDEVVIKFKSFLRIIQDYDPLVIIPVFNVTDNSEEIISPDEIPKSITKLRIFFGR